MKFYYLIFVALLGNIAVTHSSDSDCGEEMEYEDEEMSLLESVLLFPMSVIEKNRPPAYMGGVDCNTGLFQYLVNTCRLWLVWVFSSASDLDDGHVEPPFLITWTQGPAYWAPDWAWTPGTAIKDSVNAVTKTVMNFPTCLAEVTNACCSLTTQQILPTLQSGVCITLDKTSSYLFDLWHSQLEWPETHGDLVRYVTAILLAMSMIPLLTWKADQNISGDDGDDRNSVRSKRSLETKVEPNPPYLTKFYKHTLSPLLERSLETRVTTNRHRPKRNCILNSLKGEPQEHYLMCEYFDHRPCNCGGKVVPPISFEYIYKEKKVPSAGGGTLPLNLATKDMKEMYKGSQPTNKEHRKVIVEGTITEPGLFIPEGTKSPRQELNNGSYRASHVEAATGHVVDATGHVMDTSGGDVKSPQQRATIELYENGHGGTGLDMSFASDIGEPCFNSSFKEESLFIIKDAVETGAIGDGPHAYGPAAVITRRSPRKHLGISLEEKRISLSELSQSCEETEDEDKYEDDDSLLDPNKSLSFSGGDGLLELTVLFLVQKVYRWTKAFLRKRKVFQLSDRSGYLLSSGLNDSINKVKSLFVKPEKNSQYNVSANARESDVDQCYSHTDTSNFESVGDSFTDIHCYMLSRGDGSHLLEREASVGLIDYNFKLPKNGNSPKKALFCDKNCFENVIDVKEVCKGTEAPDLKTATTDDACHQETVEILGNKSEDVGYQADIETSATATYDNVEQLTKDDNTEGNVEETAKDNTAGDVKYSGKQTVKDNIAGETTKTNIKYSGEQTVKDNIAGETTKTNIKYSGEQTVKDNIAEETVKDCNAVETVKDCNIVETAEDDNAEEITKDDSAEGDQKQSTAEDVSDMAALAVLRPFGEKRYRNVTCLIDNNGDLDLLD